MPELIRTPLADYHLSQGAVPGEYCGAIVPARFTNPVSEHQAVRTAAGLFDFSFRAKIAVKGQDRAQFLQGMVTNDVEKLSPGRGVFALMLNAYGHLLADLRLYRAEDRYFIDADASLREKILKTLDQYIFMEDVQLEPLDLYALAFQGPRARPLLQKTLHIDLPAMNEFDHFTTNYAGFPVRVVRAGSTGEEGYEVWVSAKGMMGVWGAACGQAPTYDMLACGTEALETLRIEAGIARYGSELDEDTLPLEAGLLNAISFTKGCYIGQEVVERTRSRGHVNWKLAGLFVGSAVAPTSGEKLLSEGNEIGEITSACISPSLGRTIALAYVRREFSEPGTKIALAPGPPAQVTSLPFYRGQ